jgi:hypothetical protein
MCEALREIMAEDLKEAEDKGIGLGIELGTDRVNSLNRILIAEGRLDDLTRATSDPAYQKELIKELVPVGKE